MAEPLLKVDNLGKRFGGFVALDGINLSVQPGERVGLIGPNGSGKSTLVNCMCGTLRNETGTVHFDGHPVDGLEAHERTHRGMARSFQLPRPFPSLTRRREPPHPAALHRARPKRPPSDPAGKRGALS